MNRWYEAKIHTTKLSMPGQGVHSTDIYKVVTILTSLLRMTVTRTNRKIQVFVCSFNKHIDSIGQTAVRYPLYRDAGGGDGGYGS